MLRKRTKKVKLPLGYRPSEKEPFMNPVQHEYFRRRLLQWRGELFGESQQTLDHLKEYSLVEPDLADRATIEDERTVELRRSEDSDNLMPANW